MHSHQEVSQLASIIESLLFVSGDPITLQKLATRTKKNESLVLQACNELERMLLSRGVRLLRIDNTVSLVTNPENTLIVEDFIKTELWGELSKASLETLTIIAYRHPISRPEIDYIRGVNSAFTIRNLLTRGLIERVTIKKDVRTYFYNPTIDFMKFLGITSFAELPDYQLYRKELDTQSIAPHP